MKKILSVLIILLIIFGTSIFANSLLEPPKWTYSGSGDDVVSGFKTGDYYYALQVYHSEKGHFAVKGHYDNSYDLLINTTSPYANGLTLLMPNKEYTFEVSAKGSWKMAIYSLKTSDSDSITAKGDYIQMVNCSSDVYEVKTKGKGHFSVKAFYGMGRGDYDLLVNTTDENYSGKVLFKKKGKRCIFVITGEREFSIKPVN